MKGGDYNRSNDPSYPATVSDFRMDRFEITVGRFRKFVEDFAMAKPKEGDGSHPLIPGSGWNQMWNAYLPADEIALRAVIKCNATEQAWTDVPGVNEALPMNCINWYESFAFCAWDGGRLPTEAEWNYAAAGGAEQRQYPWGSMAPDFGHAVIDCEGDGAPATCTLADILHVGSKPAGDGRYGQADLTGSVAEWNLDWYADTCATQCVDCANLQSATYRVYRGGSWSTAAAVFLSSSYRRYADPAEHNPGFGSRCARNP